MSKRLPLIRNVAAAVVVLVAAGLLGAGYARVASNAGDGWIFRLEMRQALIGFASALLATALAFVLVGRGQWIASRFLPELVVVGRFLRRVVTRIIGAERADMVRPWFSAALWVPAAIAAGAFLATRDLFQGDCLLPSYSESLLFWFFFLASLFSLSFVWLTSEVVHPLIDANGLLGLSRRLAAVALGLVVYGAIAVSVWLASDLPQGYGGDEPAAVATHGFWGVGLLLQSGNFSDYSCGY